MTTDAQAIAMLRLKMGPMLRSDYEARMMLLALSLNPAVQAFARHFQSTEPSA